MAGRKSKYTPERVKQITDAIASGATHKDAYTVAGIGHDTFYRWIETKTEFSEAVTYAESQAHLGAVKAIRDAIDGVDENTTSVETYTETRLDRHGKPYEYTRTVRKASITKTPPDWRAAVEYLKRRDSLHWSDKINITLEGGLSAELINQIVRAAQAAGVERPSDIFQDLLNELASNAANRPAGSE